MAVYGIQLVCLHRYRLKYSYSHGTSTKPLLDDTIGERFDKVVERFPEREAYVFCEDGHRATFSEFKPEVRICS